MPNKSITNSLVEDVRYVDLPNFYFGVARLRPAGVASVDVYDPVNGPDHWQIDMNGFMPYVPLYWRYYEDGQLLFHNDRFYKGVIGEDYDQPPALDGDSKWQWLRDTSVVTAISGQKSVMDFATAENVTNITVPTFTAPPVGRILVIATTDGFTSNGGVSPNFQLAGYQKQTDVGPASSTEVPNLTIWMKNIQQSDSGSVLTPTHDSNPNIIRGLTVMVVENMTGLLINNNDNNPASGETNKSVGAGILDGMSVIVASQSSSDANFIAPAGFTVIAGATNHGADSRHVVMHRVVDPDTNEPPVSFSQSVVSLAIRLNCL